MTKSIACFLLLAATTVGCAASSEDTTDTGASAQSVGRMSIEEAQAAFFQASTELGFGDAFANRVADIAAKLARTDVLTALFDRLAYGTGEFLDVLIERGTFADTVPRDDRDLHQFVWVTGVGAGKSPKLKEARLPLTAAMASRIPNLSDLDIIGLMADAGYQGPSGAAGFYAALRTAGFESAPSGKAYEWGMNAIANMAVVDGALGTSDAAHDLVAGSFEAEVLGTFLSKFAGVRGQFRDGDLLTLCDRMNDAVARTGSEPTNAVAVARQNLRPADFTRLGELRASRR